jgi:hypothetical protein
VPDLMKAYRYAERARDTLADAARDAAATA